MSKSIYDEALDILLNSLQDPQDEDNDCYMLDTKQLNKVCRALKQAQKQEKLLELYRDLSNYVCEECYSYKLPEITRLKIIIKELEDE